MNEKAYKAMGLAGAAGIAVGIVVTVIGIAAGVISIISGARLLKEKKGIIDNEYLKMDIEDMFKENL